ncbi:MAG: transcriptional regulator [Candidatus Fermentibacter sp.]|nr:transcriptional regulator [Candidatus Fermentibacter sp.]
MPEGKRGSDEEIRGTLEGVSGLLSHRVRLGICVLLSRHSALSFSRLKELLGETDGSLGAQLRKLEDEGFISARKEFRDRKPVTWYTLTPAGRDGLHSHFDALESLIGRS